MGSRKPVKYPLELLIADTAGLCPEEGRVIARSHQIGLVPQPDRNFHLQLVVFRQIQRPQQGLHDDMAMVLDGFFNEHLFFPTSTKRKFSAK
jgi:hypothetical protein